MQILSTRYAACLKDLRALNSADSPAVWQGLILGLCALGYKSEDRGLRDAAASVLNDGQPLPGVLIALITELSIDAEEGFKKGSLSLLLPENDKEAQLTALSELCYGLTLGLSYAPRDKSAGVQSAARRINDPQLLDLLRTLQQLQRVDEEGELDADDLNTVLSYIEDELKAVKQRSTRH